VGEGLSHSPVRRWHWGRLLRSETSGLLPSLPVICSLVLYLRIQVGVCAWMIHNTCVLHDLCESVCVCVDDG
jgi:hypothetical protein